MVCVTLKVKKHFMHSHLKYLHGILLLICCNSLKHFFLLDFRLLIIFTCLQTELWASYIQGSYDFYVIGLYFMRHYLEINFINCGQRLIWNT